MAGLPSQPNSNGVDALKLSEASEDDPCIENKPRSRMKFLNNSENRLRELSGLSRVGLYVAIVGLLLLVVLFVTVICLASLWPRKPHHEQFPVCKEPACLRAAARVQEFLNVSINRCNDMWTWACGGWLSKNPLPPERSTWSIREQLEVEEAARVRQLINTLPLPLHSGTVEWKLKHFYEACLEVDNVNADRARPLSTIISELGGWYILRDWDLSNFDYNYILKQLHVKYGVTPYFKVSVQPNPNLPGKNSITISPSGLGLPDRSYYYTPQNDPIQKAYKLLIRDVVLSLSATKTLAEQFGEDIFYYEKRIAEITPHSFDINNPVNAYNPIRISELKITAASLPLQDILTAMFPEANITEETEVIVTSIDYLNKISLITAATDRAMLNGYVIWTLARKYLPYLSSQLTSTEDSFNAELLGIRKALPRWEKCARLVQNFMGLAIQSFFESQEHIKSETKEIVNQIFLEIVRAAKNKLRKYNISPHLFKYLLNKLNNLHLQIGLPDVTKTDNYIKMYYTKLIVLKANLFESFKNGLNFIKKSEEQLLNVPQPEDQLVKYAANYPLEVSYVAPLNTIVVPRGLLQASIFENQYPSSIQYGQLGIKIATAVISSIFPYESSWSADLKLLTPFHSIVNESHSLINLSTKSLSTFTTSHQLVTENTEDAVALSAYKHISSVSLALEALTTSLIGKDHIHQPSLERFEDAALFFITYTQGQCSTNSKQQELYNNVVLHKLTNKAEFETAWWLVDKFSTALGCSNKVL